MDIRKPHLFDWLLAILAIAFVVSLSTHWVHDPSCCMVLPFENTGWGFFSWLVVVPLFTAFVALAHLFLVMWNKAVALESLAGSLIVLSSGISCLLMAVSLIYPLSFKSTDHSGPREQLLTGGKVGFGLVLALVILGIITLRFERDKTPQARDQSKRLRDSYGSPVEL